MTDPAPATQEPALPRVVSLLPSATDILCLLGAADALVGRSHECDEPAAAHAPVLTAARIRATEPAAIDREVRQRLPEHGSLYSLDEARLSALRPDIIITQSLCEVCSIDLQTVQRLAASLPGLPEVLDLNPHTVEDILDDVLRIGETIGRQARARAEVVALRERLFAAGECVNPFDDGPVVAFLEWTEPMFCAGHWNVQLIERAGARHPFNPTQPAPDAGAAAGPQQGERRAGKSVVLPPEILAAARPGAIVIAPCGVPLAQGLEMARSLSRHAWWSDLPAVKLGKVAVVDGNRYFSRPSQRIVEAFEWLVGWLQQRPEMIPPGFAWAPLTRA
ncbi:MAG: ABC transporter substrate-binding protein [Tepidisphaera sp.]|nr:ABC transporter substrate-binding protein [Tepidisphaera sp.]